MITKSYDIIKLSWTCKRFANFINSNIKSIYSFERFKDRGETYILLWAIKYRHPLLLKSAINCGAALYIGLYEACEHGNLPIVKYMIENFKKNAFDLQGGLHWACRSGNLPIVKYFRVVADSLLAFYISSITIAVGFIISGFWLAYASLSSYKSLKTQNIEPWLKKRYIIVAISAIIYGSLGFVQFLFGYDLPTGHPQILFAASVSSTVVVLFSISSYFTWVMPEKFRQFLNRGYQALEEEELSEEEIMKMMKEG